MIKAVDIVSIVEDVTVQPVGDWETFVSQIQKNSLGMTLESKVQGNDYIIYTDLEIQNASNYFHSLCYNFGKFLFRRLDTKILSDCLPKRKTSVQTDNSVSVEYLDGNAWDLKEPQDSKIVVKPGWVVARLSFSFSNFTIAKVIKTDKEKFFYKEIGKIFLRFLEDVSKSRSSNFLSKKENKEFLLDTLKDIVSKSGLPLTFSSFTTPPIVGQVSIFYDLVISKNEQDSISFISQFFRGNNNNLLIPLKKLEEIFSSKFKFMFDTRTGNTPTIYLKVPDSRMKITVFLYGGPRTRSNFYRDISVNNFGITLNFSDFGELLSLYGSKTDELSTAIKDVFWGYKKLINNFSNKPDKKTNADW